jgi:hypothetical protein
MAFQKSVAFQRAGEILIQLVWLEKRLIDGILLRNHPDLKDDFNTGQISPKHGDLRIEWHKKMTADVVETFIATFPDITDPNFAGNLRFLGEIRNAIAHGDISYYRDKILFVPMNDKRLKTFDRITQPVPEGPYDDGTRCLNLAEERVYKGIKSLLDNMEKTIEWVAESFGVDNEKIK